jgi:RNA polymerase sigma-70 factor (ECF subfamily)
MKDGTDESSDIMRSAVEGDSSAQGLLFAKYRDRLRRMIRLRMDRRMQGRLDASDVLQDAYLEFSRSLPDYAADPTMPFYLWLRTLTGRKLHALHRKHLGAEMRDAGREVCLHRVSAPETNSGSLAELLMGRMTSPSQVIMREELQLKIQAALDRMDEIDREVLALRHFEHLSNAETARVLSVTEKAASIRFVRALKRFKDVLADVPGLFEEAI